MRGHSPIAPLLARAPHYAGALLFLAVSLVVGSCGDKQETTPDWSEEKEAVETTPAKATEGTEPAPADEPETAPPTPPLSESENAPAVPPDSETPPAEAAEQDNTLRFLSYNIRNYLTMSRYVDGERQDRRKPEKEIEAVVKIVTEANPDVLGICEIGTKEDLADFQSRLAEAGLDLPHSEYAGGADETRHLALLSRLPIVATHSQGADGSLTYKSVDLDNNPKVFAMQRGILDATVQDGDKQVRFLGVHLKSKREIPDGHQDLMRRNEAYLLRRHVDRILEETPDVLLCVYGDFNETRRESPVRSIQGPYNTDRYLEPLSHKDSRGEVWTQYWDYQHVYSRFDYVLANKALRPFFDFKSSGVIDDPVWSVASDHRALLTIFKWDDGGSKAEANNVR